MNELPEVAVCSEYYINRNSRLSYDFEMITIYHKFLVLGHRVCDSEKFERRDMSEQGNFSLMRRPQHLLSAQSVVAQGEVRKIPSFRSTAWKQRQRRSTDDNRTQYHVIKPVPAMDPTNPRGPYNHRAEHLKVVVARALPHDYKGRRLPSILFIFRRAHDAIVNIPQQQNRSTTTLQPSFAGPQYLFGYLIHHLSENRASLVYPSRVRGET